MRAEDAHFLTALDAITREAGDIALRWFSAGAATQARVDWKHGGSPVSEADFAVDRFLRERLGALVPDAGWLSEETADTPDRLGRERVFIVDPIDGTRGFIKGDWRWAVSVALVERGVPTFAVLRLPAGDLTYTAAAGGGARLNGRPIEASRRAALPGGVLAGPQPLIDALARAGLEMTRTPRVPSLAYRLARVASGEVDAAIASTDAWDWDIAAADLIVRESGGLLTGLDGRPPAYNSERPRHGVLGAAPARLQPALLASLRAVTGAPDDGVRKP